MAEWFKLKALASGDASSSVHQFGCSVGASDYQMEKIKCTFFFFFFLPLFLISPFTGTGIQCACQLPRSCPFFPVSCRYSGPTLSMFDTLGGECVCVCCRKGALWLWLASLPTFVTMVAKIPMTSFSLALLQLQRARQGLVVEQHSSWMGDACCISKKGWRFVGRNGKCAQSLLVCKHSA